MKDVTETNQLSTKTHMLRVLPSLWLESILFALVKQIRLGRPQVDYFRTPIPLCVIVSL